MVESQLVSGGHLGDVTGPDLDRDHIPIWTSVKGMLGLTPLPGGELWQLQSAILPGEAPETLLSGHQRGLRLGH